MKSLLAIGSYTDGKPYFQDARGSGITFAEFDHDTGHIEQRQVFRDVLNPSYLAGNLRGHWAAISENLTGEGAVMAFDAGDIPLLQASCPRPRWIAPSGGRASCHLTLLDKPDAVVAVSYLDGCAVLLDASTGKQLQRYVWRGSGPVSSRQEASHPHQAVVTPCGGWLLVPDLGADRIRVGKIHEASVDFDPDSEVFLPSGTGPRHLVFHPHSPFCYVLGELDGLLHPVEWRDAQARVFPATPTLDSCQPGEAHASAIRFHPRLPLVYAANRSRHEVAVLDVTAPHSPEKLGGFPCGGLVPRDIQISSCGNWLLAACQESHAICVHRLDSWTGLPIGKPPERFTAGSPVALLFADTP